MNDLNLNSAKNPKKTHTQKKKKQQNQIYLKKKNSTTGFIYFKSLK